MTIAFAATPVRYSADLEHIDPSEPQLARDIAETMLSIARKTYADSGHATRAVHAKSHGLLSARLEVLPGLPDELAQGLFSRAQSYEAVIRLSTTPGDLLHDTVSTPRGMALKVLDVDGPRLVGSEHSTSQDFVMVNGKTFNSASGKAFLSSLKMLALTTDRFEGMKRLLSKIFKGLESAIETVGQESATLKALGGNPQTHILGDSFFSQLPLRHGDHIAKLAIIPVSDNLRVLTDQRLDTSKDPDALRHQVNQFFVDQTAIWHLQVQLCTDIAQMPIEAVTTWDEDKSPFITVARLVAEPQPGWNEERSRIVDDAMHFSPWNGIAAHRPLGAIMRLRKLAYEQSAAFRSQRNPTPVSEPVSCPFTSMSAVAEHDLQP